MTRRRNMQHMPDQTLMPQEIGALAVPIAMYRAEQSKVQQLSQELRTMATVASFEKEKHRRIHKLDLIITKIIVLANALGAGKTLRATLNGINAAAILIDAAHDCFTLERQAIESGLFTSGDGEATRQLSSFTETLYDACKAVQEGYDNGETLILWIEQYQQRIDQVIQQARDTVSKGGGVESDVQKSLHLIGYGFYLKCQFNRTVWHDTAASIWRSIVDTPEDNRSADQRTVYQHWTDKKTTNAQRQRQCRAVFNPPGTAVNAQI